MQDGVQNIENQKYKNEILGRTRQGMERNSQIEELSAKAIGADGNLDMGVYNQLAAIDPDRAKGIRDALAPKQEKQDWTLAQVGDGQGGLLDVWVNKQSRQMQDLQGNPIGGGLLAPDQGQAPQDPSNPVMGGGFDTVIDPLLKREGGYVANDAGAGPTNFGINSRANPDVDVANLTPEKAKELYRARYWDVIGGDSLPPAIQAAAMDAAVNQGPGRAKEWIAASGGDPQQFAALRQQHYDSLIQRDPSKYGPYAASWRNRNNETSRISAPGTLTDSRIGRRPAKAREESDRAPPSGYTWGPDGASLTPIPGGPADRKNNPMPADQAKAEMSIRKEYSDLIKEDRSVINAYNKVEAAASKPTAQNDLALIFGYMKMLDPGSVVREGEFATAQNTGGLDDNVRNAYNKALNGERLNPEQRKLFLSSAAQLRDVATNRINEYTQQYGEMAEQYGYDPVRATGSKAASKEYREAFQKGGDMLKQAREAIQKGAPREAVRQRMIEQGFRNLAERI
ncbi:MAG TPA: glycosyl hydrolase 108 family protein [Pseudoxanthomonas sp.]|nr:glycosyl hydrolase 108 family protein [Pseudoxanthomonas sp.]